MTKAKKLFQGIDNTKRFIQEKVFQSKLFPIYLFVFYFVIMFVLYIDYYINDLVPISGDGIQYFSLRLFARVSIENGELPLWNPYLENGIPHMGDLYSTMYLPNFLLMWLPLKQYIYAYFAFHLALGATFTYLFLRKIKCTQMIALCTSLIYYFSIHIGGYRKNHIVIIATIVYLPVILYFIECFLQQKKKRYLIYATIAMSMQFYSGMIQHVIYTDIVVGLYFVYRWISRKNGIKSMIITVAKWILMYLVLIAAQLIPTAELVGYYASQGAADTSFGTYSSYALHPIKLLMLFFPQMYGKEQYRQPLGGAYATEIDIELFLGISFILFIGFVVSKYIKKSEYMRIALLIIILTTIFAMNPNIPLLGELLYKVPVIGGFRCCSRILFISIFFVYVMFAKGMSILFEESEVDRFIEYGERTSKLLLCFLIIVGGVGITLISVFLDDNTIISILPELWVRVKPTVLGICFFCILILVLKVISWIHNDFLTLKKYLLLWGVVVLTIFETWPYYHLAYTTDLSSVYSNTTYEALIEENIGNGKILVTCPYIGGSYSSIVENNANVEKQIPSINAFVAFNNPNIFKFFTNEAWIEPSYNFSGLMTGFYEISNVLGTRNDILSMLGVKYIVDQEHIIENLSGVINSKDDVTDVVFEENETIYLKNEGEYAIYSHEVELENNTYYKVSFSCNSEFDYSDTFFVDFYTVDGYDNQAQDVRFNISSDRKEYSAIINTEQIVGENIEVRIVSCIPDTISITNFKVEEIRQTNTNQKYKRVASEENVSVYENEDAKDVLYVPNNVIEIDKIQEVFDNIYEYDFSNNVYVTDDIGGDFVTAECKLSNIIKKNNSVSADCVANNTSFIVFSQNYYPGWKVYIDGKQQTLVKANGLLQGVVIPAGKHTVRFVYQPVSVLVGIIISAMGIVMILRGVVKEKKKEKLSKC